MASPLPAAGQTAITTAVTEPRLYEGSDLEALLVLHRYRDWILAEMRPYLGGRMAEIGAGIGAFSPALRENATALDLIEPSPAQSQVLNERFGTDPTIRILAISAEQWATEATPQSYDTVVMINVLEHIDDDAAVLRSIHRALQPAGRLLIFVPALMILYSAIDRLVGHHRRYGRTELEEKVAAAGFRIEHCRYFDILGTVPWFLVNRLGGATRFNATAAQIYDTFGVPLTRGLESIVPPPFGKNLILAATKASSPS